MPRPWRGRPGQHRSHLRHRDLPLGARERSHTVAQAVPEPFSRGDVLDRVPSSPTPGTRRPPDGVPQDARSGSEGRLESIGFSSDRAPRDTARRERGRRGVLRPRSWPVQCRWSATPREAVGEEGPARSGPVPVLWHP